MISSSSEDIMSESVITTVNNSASSSQTAAASEQPTNNSSQARHDTKDSADNKDTLLALKNQVTFAKQCIGLLQNQMKHAMDTLNILQDQVTKTQSSIDQLEGKTGSSEPLTPKIDSVVSVASGSEYGELQGEQMPGNVVPTQRMIVLDGSGQALYAVDKPVHHHIHGGPCPCHSCASVPVTPPTLGTHVLVDGQAFPAASDAAGQLMALHSGNHVYQYAAAPSTHLSPQLKVKETPKRLHERHHSSDSEVTVVKSTTGASEPQLESATKGKKSTKSSSPIATQLLQVIDVLQSADDSDDTDDMVSRVSSQHVTAAAAVNVPGSNQPFTGPIPYPIYSTSPGRHSRRSRKQDMTPVKKEDLRLTELSTATAHLYTPDSDMPGMMRVPPPVLASSLEPDFLVVPGSSYFWESPSPSASGEQGQQDTDPSASTLSKMNTEEPAPFIKLEKDTDPAQSCSVSSQSQTSDPGSSRSSSASSACDKTAVRGQEPAGAMSISTADNRSSRHSEVNVVFGCNTVPTITEVCSIAAVTSNVSTDSLPQREQREPTTPSKSRPSPLNSAFPSDSGSTALETAAVHPAVSRVTRSQKASPLNTMVTIAGNEPSMAHVTRSATLRSAHASPLNSLIVSSQQENPITRAQEAYPAEQGATSVPAYSVAQLDGADRSKCSSPTKKPNILNRNRHGKKEIPEGIVVLVPTIEDAKKLIQSTGSNKDTPVLVPQNILDRLNGEAKGREEGSALAGKRPLTAQSSFEPTAKRLNPGAVVID